MAASAALPRRCPGTMAGDGRDERVVLGPTPHAGDRVSGPVAGLQDGRPLVLVTLGTSVRVRGLPAGLGRWHQDRATARRRLLIQQLTGRQRRLPFRAPLPDGAGNHLLRAIISSRWISYAAGWNGHPHGNRDVPLDITAALTRW